MSHFTVLVIGGDPEKQLIPFQENNCGDCPKEYMEFNDVEKEYREEYENDSKDEFYCASSSSWGQELSCVNFAILSQLNIGEKSEIEVEDCGMHYFTNGKRYKCYDSGANDGKYPENKVWMKVTGVLRSTHPDKDVCFKGRIEIQRIDPPNKIPLKESYPDGFDSFIKDWAGHEKDENGRYGYWENPNAKWDWYKLGGRWTGLFKLKTIPKLKMEGTDTNKFGFTIHEFENLIRMFSEDFDRFEKTVSKYGGKANDIRNEIISIIGDSIADGKVGSPGLMTEKAKFGYADQALIRDIDFDAMRSEAEEKARVKYEMVEYLFCGHIPCIDVLWSEVLDGVEYEDLDISQKREFYHGQPGPMVMKSLSAFREDLTLTKEEKDFIIWGELADFQIDKNTYVQNAGNECFTTFAVLKDGKWYERGKMGWWACVSNKKEDKTWDREFKGLIDSISDDTMLSVYDCHI